MMPMSGLQQDQSNNSLDLGGGNSNPGSTTGSMNEYSANPPQNFSQSSAFAAAVQRAKQVFLYIYKTLVIFFIINFHPYNISSKMYLYTP